MKFEAGQIIAINFIEKLSKSVVETTKGKVWVNGDQSDKFPKFNICNFVINEIGDTFVATNDSKTLDAKGKPLFTKGETVTRQSQSIEFKSFAGDNMASKFVESAAAFKFTSINFVVQSI